MADYDQIRGPLDVLVFGLVCIIAVILWPFIKVFRLLKRILKAIFPPLRGPIS